jgi:thiol-disulfide isomerase/thioredoxin
MSDSDSKSGSIAPLFIDASVRFYSQAEFAFLDSTASRNLSRKYAFELSSIILYTSGFVAGSWQVTADATTILYLFDGLLSPLPDPISKKSALPRVLGNIPFALFAAPNYTDLARTLQIEASTQMGLIQIVPVTSQVLSELEIDPPTIALFRQEDQTVVSISDDVEELYAASYPVFRTLTAADLQDRERIVFALVSNELTDDQNDFLYDVGSKFQAVTVGWAGDDIRPYVEHAVHTELPEIAVAAVRFELGSFYDLSEEFTPAIVGHFDRAKWTDAALRALARITAGEAKPQFFSESEEPTDAQGLVTRLVGTTYAAFVLDPAFDAVVLFKRPSCPHCEKFAPVFEALAQELSAAGVSGVRFAMIDVSRNSAELPFPYMPGVPHVYVFPATNKTGGDSLRGSRDREGMIRFLKSYATVDIPFEVPPADKKQLALEFLQVITRLKTMPEEEQKKTMEYFGQISKSTGGKETAAASDEL